MKHIHSFCLLWMCQLALVGQARLGSDDSFNPPNPDDPQKPALTYTLEVRVTPIKGGNTNISSKQVQEGDSVGLFAYPATGYVFTGWQTDGIIVSTENYLKYKMPGKNAVITAVFEYNPSNPGDPERPVTKHNLSITANPITGGSFNVTSTQVEEGKTVTIEAYPNTGFEFKGWFEEDTLLSTSPVYNFRMGNKDVQLTGRFEYNPENPDNPESPVTKHSLSIVANPITGGSFNITSTQIEEGKTIIIEAYPNTGFEFKGWYEDGILLSTSSAYNYRMDNKDALLTGRFEYNPENPENPSANYWNPTTGEIYICDLSTQSLQELILDFIGGAGQRLSVKKITVACEMEPSYFMATQIFTECREYDLREATNISVIPDSAFFNCTSLTSVILPSCVQSIGKAAFSGCSALKKVSLPNSVTEINEFVFENCTSFREFIIPRSVTKIGNFAFSDCCSLRKIQIPESVTRIGKGAFSYCCSLQEVINLADEPQEIVHPVLGHAHIFASETLQSARLFVKPSNLEKFRSTGGWKEFRTIVSY